MLSVREWLGSIGLGRYAGAFEANAVDLDILPSLTDEDLERLGVLLGDRRRIAKLLEKNSGAALPHDAAPSSAFAPVETATAEGERRQVTVLYCDLVGSTHLSHILDPEAYRAVMSRYHETAIEAIQRFDGFVQQIQGDGIVAYFGYPIAHEQEADRAIRAGLAILDGLAGLDSGVGQLNVRLGIASGLVVVSHVLATDKSAVGETPNFAQRLQTAAHPGEIIVSDRTRILAAGGFEYEDRGAHKLKGMDVPVRLWRVAGLSAAVSRFEAATEGRLTPMVGREQEMDLLLDRWDQARGGSGQVALLQGEPGIGKSRMLRAFRERLGDRMQVPLQYQCSPYYQNSAFYPIIDHLQRTLGLMQEHTAERKLDRLEGRLIGELKYSRAECHLLALMLSIECASRYGKLRMTPQRQKEDTIQILVDVVATIARRQAAAVLFEDAHWADPTTLGVLDALIDRAATLPLLVLITFRPELEQNWAARSHVSRVALSRLGRAQSATLVMQVPGGKPLPGDLVTEIVDKTDGVPLFLEELTKAVLELNLVVLTGDRYEYTGPAGELTIPATLRDSLMARLDRLFPVKELAQIGAVIGREFSHELLALVSPLAEPQLTDGMDKLVGSELIFRRGSAPNATYLFKHALVKDAAYESLLKSKRSQLHAQIADALETEFSGLVAAQPEMLAHHLTEAGLHERAVPCWTKAGQQALARVALAEAVAHLTTALKANQQLSASVDRDLQELDIRMLLGTAYLSWKGHAAHEVLDAMGPARTLAIKHRQAAKLVPILFYIWMHHTARLELGLGARIAEELDTLSQSASDSYAFVVARNVENMTYGWMGNFTRARAAAERGVRAYDPERHAPFVHIYNHDQKCGILSWAVHFLWMLGYPDQAQRAAQEQVDLARRLAHPYNLGFSLTTGCAALVLRGETALARQWIAEADAAGKDSAISYVTHFFVPFWTGLVQVTEGENEAGYANITAAWEYFDDGRGLLLRAPFAKMWRATAAMRLGRLADAGRLLDDALAIVDKTDHRMHEAELYRVLGQLGQRQSDLVSSEQAYRKAIQVARSQSAKGFELRAAMSLARLWQLQERKTEARELLAPVYNWFTEGLGTRDLIEARGLLEELRDDSKVGR